MQLISTTCSSAEKASGIVITVAAYFQVSHLAMSSMAAHYEKEAMVTSQC